MRHLSSSFAIAGAGPGGLTAALAFHQRGYKTTVYERSKELSPAGSGIALAPNAMLVLRKLGVDQAVTSQGMIIEEARITDGQERTLSAVSLAKRQAKSGIPSVAISRPKLSQILASHLPTGTIQFSKAVVGVAQDTNSSSIVDLLFEGSGNKPHDALIGCDGIHSQIRKQLCGHIQPRYSGYTCWRGIVDLVHPNGHGVFLERWHRGLRFGSVPISDTQTYWFATANTPPGTDEGSVHQRFEHFGGVVPAILEKVESASTLKNDIYDLPSLRRWSDGSVTLLGDAAHAMTPNLGQGACQAIVDASSLAASLSNNDSIPEAFGDYERQRKPKSALYVRGSRLVGRVATAENALACWLRNTLLRLTP